MLIGESNIEQARVKSESGGYDVLPANRELSGAEIDLVQMEQRERQLKAAIDTVATQYDFVLIDCPPTLSLLTLNGLAAAHGVIIPMQCEYFALEGLSDLVNTIKRVHRNINDDLRVIGLLRVMFDPRMTLQQQSPRSSRRISATRFSRLWCRATCAWPKPPATACPAWCTTAARVVRSYISFGAEMIERVKKDLK